MSISACLFLLVNSGCKKEDSLQPQISDVFKPDRTVTIQESKEFFQLKRKGTGNRFQVNQNDWLGLEPAWAAANEVALNDSSTVVIAPIADSTIMVNPFLDAYVVFFEDSLNAIQMHVLFFQADTNQYLSNEYPSISNFSGLIWEFYDEEDTYGVTVVEDGIIMGCGCSSIFGSYIDTVTVDYISPRTKITKCPWKRNIWDWIAGAAGDVWKVVKGFFKGIQGNGGSGGITGTGGTNGTGGTGGSGGTGGTGGSGSGGGSGLGGFGGFGFGGNGGGGGNNVILNLSSVFSEWQLKQMLQAANWMNETYGLNWDVNEIFLSLDLDCIWEISDFIQNPGGPTIDEDETLGPQCEQEYLTQWILEMFPHLTEDDEVEIYYLLHNPTDRDKLELYTDDDAGRTDNMREYIHLKNTYSQYNVDRFIDIWSILENDPNALAVNCILENSEYDIEFWSTLASYNPPQSVHERIAALGEGWMLQSFITPTLAPQINLDYFSINILLMPIKNEQTGERWLPEDFLEYLRTNINIFVDTEASEFTPYKYPVDFYDFNLWNSTSPVTSVLSIEIPADDGSVICSKSESDFWIFSTLKAPFFPLSEDGFHPVSGNRQFGFITNSNQSYTLYTKGADRVFFPPNVSTGNSLIPYLTQQAAFSGADALWNSFQVKTRDYIISHGGVATIVPPTKNRPKVREALKALLSGNIPITIQNLCGN